MAPKGRLRLWIFCATAFVGCVALWNSKLITSAPANGLHQNVKRNSKRAVDEGDSVPWKREVHSGFSSIPYNDGDNVNTQPSAKCPVAAPSMLPCSCRSLARGIVVECTSPETRNALSDALSGLRDYVMSEAKLTGLTIELDNEVFDPMQFLTLQFLRGNVRIRGANGTFSFAHDSRTKRALRSVHFVSSSIDLGSTTLSNAPSTLTALEFLEANFSQPYRPEWFADLHVEQLRILDSINIKDPIAAGLVGLQVYQHSKCALTSISKDFLPKDKTELRRLDFSINSLESLPKDIFEDIPRLEEVLLVSNKFSALEEHVFGAVLIDPRYYSFHRLDVNANYHLECQSLAWIENKENCEKVRGFCIHSSKGEIDVREYCELIHSSSKVVSK